MGTNSSKFDLHYAKKSMKELQSELKQFKDDLAKLEYSNSIGIQKHYAFYNSHIAKLQLLIAERIGK